MDEKIESLDFEEVKEEIEVLDETEKKEEKVGEVIDINRLFDLNEKEEKIAEEQIKNEEKKKDNKIFKIQIGLIIALVVVASLVYFFGYDLLEPYIKID